MLFINVIAVFVDLFTQSLTLNVHPSSTVTRDPISAFNLARN